MIKNPHMTSTDIKNMLLSSILEIIGQTADSLLFYGLIYRNFLTKQNLGLLGFIASILRLHKLIFA